MNMPLIWNEDLNHFDEHTLKIDESGAWQRPDLPPGTACWSTDMQDRKAVLRFVCPCGCGCVIHTPIKPFSERGWNWDGNETMPTLTPSILRTTGCRWHGYLTKGVFTFC